MPRLQTQVAEFVSEYELSVDVQMRLLDLVSEVGELSKEVLKGNQYATREFEVNEHWEEEIGDVLFALICLANATHINLEEGLTSALDKYRKRMQAWGEAGSGS